MKAILTLYMADKLKLGNDDAATYMAFFVAGCYFLPLVGGFVADRFFGKYWTIVGFSLPYILGHVTSALRTTGFWSAPCRCWPWAAASSSPTSRR